MAKRFFRARGRRIVSTSGTVIKTKAGNVFGDRETVIEWDEIAWDERRFDLNLHEAGEVKKCSD